MSGYASGLNDRYAQYYSAEEYAQQTQKESGVAIGLGFNWDKEESGYIKIISVMANSSSDRAGLVAGDVITAVNNTDVIAYETATTRRYPFLTATREPRSSCI